MAQKLKTKSTPRNWCLLMHFGVSLMYLWSASESLWMRSDYILITSDDIWRESISSYGFRANLRRACEYSSYVGRKEYIGLLMCVCLFTVSLSHFSP
jgi:hypothetical protein